MILTLLLALFLLMVVFSRSKKKRKPNVPLWKHHLKLIVVSSVVLLTILILNIFRPVVYIMDYSEAIEKTEKENKRYLALNLREKRSKKNPSNIPYLFEYVEVAEKLEYTTEDKAGLQNTEFSYKSEMQYLALAYLDAIVPDTSFYSTYRIESDGEYTPNFPDTTLAYHNFVIGQQKFTDGDLKGAEHAFLKEKTINPSYDKTYEKLYDLYRFSNREKWKTFLIDWDNAKHLDQDQVAVNYFHLGEYLLYFRTIYSRSFLDLNYFALIAGLIISIVWMIFLRSMDFFDKERWIDMILVFVGGALFTNLCLFLYDTAHYDWGIVRNGEFWNDLFYSIGVIGFSEELVKLVPWLLFVKFSKRVNEPYDYILYASVAALGFAFTENLIYLESPQNIVIRFLMSTTSHMFDASLIAYSIILAKYKYKTRKAKIVAPIIGFALACFSHGFYDFWLISASTVGMSIVTTIFFLFTLHIWFYMINNATNHSSFFDKRLLKVHENMEFLSLSILGIILLQYVFLSVKYGAQPANLMLRFGTTFTIGFLLYVTFIMSNFKAIQGRWFKYSFPLSKLINEYVGFPFPGRTSAKNNIGLHLRLFAPKDNRYIGDQFPVSGHCERKITVSGDENCYVFRLNKGITLAGHHTHLVIIKPKSREDELTEDKIEVYVLFIPLGINLQSDALDIKQLRYTGKTYSRPV